MSKRYDVLNCVYHTDCCNCYLARDLESESPKMHLVVDTAFPTELTTTLDSLRNCSEEIQKERPKVHYDWLFPRVKDIVVDDDDEVYRKLVVLEAVDDDYGNYIFLKDIIARGERVDFRTSAWIYGRLLKFEQFLSLSNRTYAFNPDNIIINPTNHRLMLVDYTVVGRPTSCAENAKLIRENFMQTAEFILKLIDEESWHGERTYDEKETSYRSFLNSRRQGFTKATGERQSIVDFVNYSSYESLDLSHREFYRLVDSLWGREYHPFTTLKK